MWPRVSALAVIANEKYLQVLRLFLDILVEQNCSEFAVTLCTSCLSLPRFKGDFYLRKRQLFMLSKMSNDSESNHDRFHDVVSPTSTNHCYFVSHQEVKINLLERILELFFPLGFIIVAFQRFS